MTVFHQPRTEDSAAGFHLRFIPCDAHGHLNAAGTVMVGSYESLDTALTTAAVGYGICEMDWMPTSEESLARAASDEHAPDVEGRRIKRAR